MLSVVAGAAMLSDDDDDAMAELGVEFEGTELVETLESNPRCDERGLINDGAEAT
jgi:hypothetical protein